MMADYSFQKDAVKAVVKTFKKHDRCKLYLPPGSGKTRTSLKLHDKLDSTLTVYVVPTLNLLGQTFREWFDHREWLFRSLGVCSDQEVANLPDEDQYTLNVTTNVAEVSDFMQRTDYKVIFATYHSLPVIISAQSLNEIEIDFVIFDEAHRTVGSHDKHFAKGINDENLKCRKRLFQTATPRYIDERYGKEVVCSMDDEEKYGPVAFKLSFREAIKRGTLCDYQVAISVVSRKNVGNIVKDSVRSDSFKTVSLYQAIHEHKLNKGITYHSTIQKSRIFSSHFQAAQKLLNEGTKITNVQSTFVHSGSSVGDRQNALQMLSPENKQRAFVSNCKLYAEGVNIPNLDFIAIMDEKTSMVDIIQNIGRVLRTAKGKKIGTVVIPVLLDDDSDVYDLDYDSFRPISRILSALKSHDDLLAQVIDTLNTDVRITPIRRTALTEEIEGRVRVHGVNVNISSLKVYQKSVISKIVDLDANNKKWNANFEKYIKYLSGSSRSTQSLRTWVEHQRRLKKDGVLSKDRIQKLESINFVWNPVSDRNSKWHETLREMAIYKEDHGKLPSVNHPDFARFYASLYQQFNEGKIQPNKIKAIEKLGWNISLLVNQKYHRWVETFNKLKSWVEKHLEYPSVTEDRSLATWCQRQRSNFKKGALTEEKIVSLRSINFNFGLIDSNKKIHQLKWEKNCAAASIIIKKHKTIPNTKVNKKLFAWRGSQRTSILSNQMSEERKKMLLKHDIFTKREVLQYESKALCQDIASKLTKKGTIPKTTAGKEKTKHLNKQIKNMKDNGLLEDMEQLLKKHKIVVV